MKKEIRIIILLFLISMLLSACTFNAQKTSETEEEPYEDKYEVIDNGPVKGGAVKLFTTPIDTLNPILTNNRYVQDFLGLIFEGLYKLDTTGQPVPVLAKSSVLSEDGLTMTVYLKDDIKWHDDMSLKPEDVVFTINTIMDSKNGSVYIENVRNISSVSAGEQNSVVIRLKQPYSFIKNELTFPIIPMHRFINEKISDKKSKVNLLPIGTGPYSFGSYDTESSLKLRQNENWWNSSGGGDSNDTSSAVISTPYISTVEIKILSNLNAANNAFQTRDIDVLPADYNEFRKYIGRTDITLKRYTGKNYEFLSLNLKRGPLSDKRVRNALNILINKKQLIDTAASGIAVAAEIPVMPSSWIYQLKDFEQGNDFKKAQELLSQSGYVFDSDKNAYLKKTTKKPLELKLIVNDDNSLRYNAAKEVASQLSKKGIAVEISKIPWADVSKTMKNGNYDMALMGYRLSSIPDLSFAYSADGISSGLNVAGYSNPNVDNLLKSILSENNSEEQKASFIKLLDIITEDRPYIGLYFLNESVMYGKSIRGAINPYIWDKYNDISKWYLP
ncbi:peptide/nickel transport system substrate-binding protein [Ruminiclostridium sufflavum DSM 19573]|uniref:Peptide/nickel transport system substrate-binding protein n=1 Tax=Ruminiclostridium sufflavum DSM 19573 TaxID=1121337 RepID=A0A318Y393_9FIRM|nr:peptide ABC transporter substrate-binding protein [Ruminiclostridium sufflavum]PYG89907.1 peptide/nickel transport system substrate-binding protein [Ruminiclostridium sufflavum DSM 19573]